MNTRIIDKEIAFFTVLASTDLWREFRKWMFPGKKTANFYNYRSGDIAAENNYTGLIIERGNFIFSNNIINKIAHLGNLQVIKYIHSVLSESYTYIAIDNATRGKHLDVVKFLYQNLKGPISATQAMSYAVINGHLEIVKYLCQTKKFAYSNYAINKAIANGHLDVIVYLHSVNRFICSSNAIITASENKHLDVVIFLHTKVYNIIKNCIIAALKVSIVNEHIEIAKYLIGDNKINGYIGLNIAARYGQLDLIKYLCSIDIRCTDNTLNSAAKSGRFEVVKFVYNNTQKPNILQALKTAIKYQHNNIIIFFEDIMHNY